ncbi:MAG: hypothetical protein SRB2_04644 [Desulfobacteraceae bacterium Eth-SRB2]|nr:MAG: hypothetical protein SRB2_04644 [Desulfobacteraceae bacterium Eth-SRB2]
MEGSSDGSLYTGFITVKDNILTASALLPLTAILNKTASLLYRFASNVRPVFCDSQYYKFWNRWLVSSPLNLPG